MVLIIFENSRQISFFITFCKNSRNNMTISSIITEHWKIWWWCNHFILHPFDSWTTVVRSIRKVEEGSQFIGREITSLREKSYQKEAKSDISKRDIEPTKDIMLRVRYHQRLRIFIFINIICSFQIVQDFFRFRWIV